MCTQSSTETFLILSKIHVISPDNLTPQPPPPHRLLHNSSFTSLFSLSRGTGISYFFSKYESLHKCLSWKQIPPVPIFLSFYRRGKHNTAQSRNMNLW